MDKRLALNFYLGKVISIDTQHFRFKLFKMGNKAIGRSSRSSSSSYSGYILPIGKIRYLRFPILLGSIYEIMVNWGESLFKLLHIWTCVSKCMRMQPLTVYTFAHTYNTLLAMSIERCCTFNFIFWKQKKRDHYRRFIEIDKIFGL